MCARPIACVAALTLSLGACAVASSDSFTRVCDDYATGLQAVTPLKAELGPKIVRVIDAANTLSGPVCSFGSAGAHFDAAVAGWARAGA